MSIDGTHDTPMLPGLTASAGADLGSAIVLPPGGQVFYVRGTGGSATADGTVTNYSYDPPGLQDRLIATVRKALTYVTSARGDTIVVLPGHTETISAADSWPGLVANTRIIGVGTRTSRPTFTWSIAGSTVLFDVANTSIENCILNMDPGTGTVNVAAPITISAAGCCIRGCTIRMGTDANSKVTIGITTTAAGDDCEISGNHIYGATAAEATTLIQLVGADRLRMVGNYIAGASSAVGVGVVRFATTASLDIYLAHNVYINRKASSTAAVTGLAGVSGVSLLEHFAYLDDSSKTAWLTSTGIMTFHRPTVTNLAGETGTEAVGATSA